MGSWWSQRNFDLRQGSQDDGRPFFRREAILPALCRMDRYQGLILEQCLFHALGARENRLVSDGDGAFIAEAEWMKKWVWPPR